MKAWMYVIKGRVTWEKLEQHGLALPKKEPWVGYNELMNARKEREARIRAEIKKHECVVPRCKRKVKSRGLCASCYEKQRKNVANGQTTWEKLEELKLSLPLKDQFSEDVKKNYRNVVV